MATTTTTTTPTGWAADAAFTNWQKAQQIAAQPYNPYQGNMLAPWTAGQQLGYNGIVNGAGVGMQAQQQAQGAALNAANWGPQQVAAQGYNPAMQGAVNTAAATAGPAAQTTPAQMQAANAGPAAMQQVYNTEAFTAGPASQMGAASMNAASMNAASAGPAQQMQAAQMGRGDVRNVAAGDFTQANLGAYMNPYIGSVVNSTLGQLGRQNDILQSQSNAKAAASGAFGGGRQAVMNAENNRAFLDTAASTTANLYNQGFNTAQSAISNDQNRALSAAQSNQGQDFAVGNLNTSNRQNSNLQNMLAGNNMAQFNAGNQQAANQFNAGNQQAANAANAGYAQDAASRNMAATNARAEYNTNNYQNAANTTIAAHNAALANQAAATNQMSQYNAGLQQAANAANAGYAQGAGLANQNAINNMAALNSGYQQTSLSQTAAANNAALANQAAAQNAAGQFNSDINLRSQLANQSAAQNAINSQITAANALNGMGLDEQTRAMRAAQAQMAAGQSLQTQDQAAIDQQYQQWLQQQNYPASQLGILQQGLNGYNSGSAQTSPYYSNTGANILAGGLGIGALGAGILQNGSSIASGASSLANMLPDIGAPGWGGWFG
jgi:hypothetical protein